jgi:LacI family transcriptional regulator
MAVTLKDIAQRCGVSMQTASMVLNTNQGHLFRLETRKRVLQAAQELGYRPNSSAKAMSSGRFGCAALVLSTDGSRSTLPAGLLAGICDRLSAHDLHLTITRLSDEKLTSEGFVPKILREWMADGLLLNYTDNIPQSLTELIERYSLPSVWINTKRDVDSIYPDDLAAGERATQMLIEVGHRRIAYIHSGLADGIEEHHYSVKDRREGYLIAMRRAGLEPLMLHGPRTDKSLAQELRELFASPQRPTGIVLYALAPNLAITAASVGLSIPRDLSIVCCAGARALDMGAKVPLLQVPERAMGEAAVEMLIKRIQAPDRHFPSQALPFVLLPAEIPSPRPV